MSIMNRRNFTLGLGAVALGGCQMSPQTAVVSPQRTTIPPEVIAMYGPRPNERFPIPAVDVTQVEERFWRTVVADPFPSRMMPSSRCSVPM